MKIVVLLFFSLYSFSAFSQDREFTYKEGDVEFHMKSYYMLIYLRGERSQEFSEEELAEIQKAHLVHINEMAKEKVVLMAGPFEGDDDKRGILVFDLATEEEVISYAEQDPSVQAGRLTYEIHKWWTEKGGCLD